MQMVALDTTKVHIAAATSSPNSSLATQAVPVKKRRIICWRRTGLTSSRNMACLNRQKTRWPLKVSQPWLAHVQQHNTSFAISRQSTWRWSRGGECAGRELVQRLPGDGEARVSTCAVHASHSQKAPRKAPASKASRWHLICMILLLAEVVRRHAPFVITSSQAAQEEVVKKLVSGMLQRKKRHKQMLLALRRKSLQICQSKSFCRAKNNFSQWSLCCVSNLETCSREPLLHDTSNSVSESESS